MQGVVQRAFRGMDAEAERHMEVLDRPSEPPPAYRSTPLKPPFSNVTLLLEKMQLFVYSPSFSNSSTHKKTGLSRFF